MRLLSLPVVGDDYKHLPDANKIRVIYQSVTPRPDDGNSTGLVKDRIFFQCVIIGSLHRWKGQHQAISALAELVGKNINVHLLLVGDDGKRYRAELVRQAMTLESPDG